jgi:hypothetical protein
VLLVAFDSAARNRFTFKESFLCNNLTFYVYRAASKSRSENIPMTMQTGERRHGTKISDAS